MFRDYNSEKRLQYFVVCHSVCDWLQLSRILQFYKQRVLLPLRMLRSLLSTQFMAN